MTGVASSAPSLAADDVNPLSDEEFPLFQRLIYREAGIFLSEAKKELLVARLRRRLRARGRRTFLAYYRLLKRDPEERIRMLDCVSTNETQFFRESRQLEFLEHRILPGLRAAGERPPSLRVWSAGCSTGEEPYSLAMILLRHLPGWSVEILAIPTRSGQSASPRPAPGGNRRALSRARGPSRQAQRAGLGSEGR